MAIKYFMFILNFLKIFFLMEKKCPAHRDWLWIRPFGRNTLTLGSFYAQILFSNIHLASDSHY